MNILDERKLEISKRNAKKPIEALIRAECEFQEILSGCDYDNSEKYGYADEYNRSVRRTGRKEAVITGECTCGDISFMSIIMDERFMIGTLSKANGERIACAFEYATDKKLPVVAFCSGGGVRIQEGAEGLVQMAKIDAALLRHGEKGLAYISVLTDPTYGGTMASFGMMGDIIIAEPGARIGFGGKKIVETILHEKIPNDFQTAEYALKNGGIDTICERKNMLHTITRLLRLLSSKSAEAPIFKQPVFDYVHKNALNIWRNIRKEEPVYDLDTLFSDVTYLHGDRISFDDPSLPCGIGIIGGITTVFIAQSKGKTLDEKIANNFGMTRPEGYRKAMRMARLAEKFKLPILILIDSPGAHPGNEAEKNNQSIAISECMMTLLKVKTPIVTIVAGEGCSGGALALSISDKIAMFSESMYAVISPESYAKIIYDSPTPNEGQLARMNYTAADLYESTLIDDVLKQGNVEFNNSQIIDYYLYALKCISKYSTRELLNIRFNRIRNWGSK